MLIKKQMPKYKRLDWDSEFWQREIFSAEVSSIKEAEDLISHLQDNNRKFSCYFFAPEKLEPSLIKDLELVDTKVTFTKTLSAARPTEKDHEIFEFSGEPDADFIKLAASSGAHSRFKKDQILSEKFEELYKLWLLNSTRGQIADKVLAYYLDTGIAGFLTLKFKEGFSQIGIIAVDNASQGRNIGSRLIREAERFCRMNDQLILRVVTQEENQRAMRFYLKNNFTLENTEIIYHYHYNE